jgi:hypothetical protein
MNPKAFYILLATVLIIGTVCITLAMEASEQREFREATATNIPVLILSEEPSDISERISFGTSDIRTSIELADAADAKAVIIDDDWAKTQNRSAMDSYLSSLLDSGVIVTVLDSPDLFLRNPGLNFKAFMEGCDTYSVCKAADGSSYECNSIDDGGTGKAMAQTYCWIYEKLKQETMQESRILDLPWGTEHSSTAYVYENDYGWMNISTNYFVLNEDNERYNYYHAHFYQESVPDDNRYTADMYTKTQNTQSNLTYLYHAPTTTPLDSTVTIQFGTEVGLPDLLGVNESISWSYNIPDVIVHDRSNTGLSLIDIWHDVNENAFVGSESFYIEPAKLMKIDCQNGLGHCIQRDVYSIQFCKHNLFWNDFNTVEKTMFVVFTGLPHSLTIDSNGADGSIYEDEYPDIFESQWTTIYSEGSHVTLTDPEYYKEGYTFIGFSANPMSTTAEYPIGSSIQIMDDETLYMVWV